MPFPKGMFVGKAAKAVSVPGIDLREALAQIQAGKTIGKAQVTASTADTDYSNKLGQQDTSWFRLLRDRTNPGMSPLVQSIGVTGAYKDFDQITLSGRMAVNQLETYTLAGTANESSVTFSGRRLTPLQTQMYIPISMNRFQHISLEGSRANATIQDLMMTEWGNKVERILCQSENGGSDPADGGTGEGSEFDGFTVLADGGNIYDHAGGYLNTKLFRDLKLAVPTQWRDSYPASDYKYFVPSDVNILLQDYLAQRVTPWGDALHVAPNGVMSLFGHDIVPCQFLKTNLAGVLTQTGSASTFGSILYARPQNMYIGYRPMTVRLFIHPGQEGGVIHMSLWAEWAPQFENIAEVGKAVNVLVDVTY